tara:strand:- start:67 stop:213 length:147 start_codon:yes stop_codon:yes gene_type:complete
MGFNLQVFFDDLMAVVENEDYDEIDRDIELCRLIKEGKDYAKICGQIT